MKKGFLIVFIALLVVLNGCVQNTPTSELKIGGLFPLTGYAAFAGEAAKEGFLLAIEDSGLEVEYIIEDFHSDLQTTVTAGHKLIEVDNVPVIIGPVWAEFSEVVAPISAEKKVLFISPWMGGEQPWRESDYFFSATPSERSQIKKAVQYMKKNAVEKIVLVYSNNSWSLGHIEILKNELEKSGGINTLKEFQLNDGSTDFRTEILQIKELNPDVIYTVIATDNGQILFNRQLFELGVLQQMYVPFSRAESEVFLEQAGTLADGIIYAAPKQREKMQEFSERFEARFGKKPSAISAATTYDMTALVLNAVKEGNKTTEEIRAFLLKVENYEGYSNIITFNEAGQVASEDVIIKEISGNNPIILEN
ncbi:ABC transporter substrate-binding protein [Candidatus Micrarchaeota archaeon]|nr:ABC transporter substrate-binding protein [Candidatus Micrarchaeota archaeon]MBU1930249.1 ABC transporter substrate-binding protein [Candidatus Micrarchaeota archaeon]